LEAKLGKKPSRSGPATRSAAPKNPPSEEMSKDEVNVIAKAIEAVEELKS
jgi:hypothetical protein